MRAISVQQPWAWAIAAGFKPVENRTRMQGWRSASGETIALHAGQRWASAGAEHEQLNDDYLTRTGLTPPLRDDHPFVYGAVIAVLDIGEVHFANGTCCGPYAEHPYFDGRETVSKVHLPITAVRPLRRPVPCRGQLGLFTLPVDIEVPR